MNCYSYSQGRMTNTEQIHKQTDPLTESERKLENFRRRITQNTYLWKQEDQNNQVGKDLWRSKPPFKAGLTSKLNHAAQDQDRNNFWDEKLQRQFNSSKEVRTKNDINISASLEQNHIIWNLWFNAFSANQEALLNLQCKYQAGKQTAKHWSCESTLAKPQVFSQKYLHLPAFILFSTNTSIMV